MKLSIRHLMGGLLLLALPLLFTSCEGALDDVFGKWSRPPKSGSIRFSTTSRTIEITECDFVNPLTVVGDGKVTYSSDDPTIAEVDPETGAVTPQKTGTVTITAKVADTENYVYHKNEISYTLKLNCSFMKWDDANKKLVEADVEDGALLMPDESELETEPSGFLSYKLLPEGTYIINRDMTLTERILLRGNVAIILCDDVTLSINGPISGTDDRTSPTQYHPLSIYGQSGCSGKLVSTSMISSVEPLNIYGGQIDITSGNPVGGVIDKAIGMNVYGGTVNAVNTCDGGGTGIQLAIDGKLTIYSGNVIAKGSAGNDRAGYGISNILYPEYDTSNQAYVEVNGGSLVAISQNNANGSAGIRGHLTVNGGSVEVKDIIPGTGEIGATSRAAVSGSITVGTGVSLQGKHNSDADWVDITDNTADPKKQHIRTKP